MFWATFSAHYPFFAQRGVDWHAAYDSWAPAVDDGVSDGELFQVLCNMIEPLHDYHTSVVGTAPGMVFRGFCADCVPIDKDAGAAAWKIIENGYLRRPLHSYCNDQLVYARLANSIGYLLVRTFCGYAGNADYASGASALQSALDEIVGDARRLGRLVIDLRTNHGGSECYGLDIAGRFTDRSYLAYSVCARNDEHDPSAFTKPVAVRVRPARRRQFIGPIVVLAGRETVSAAETFLVSLAGRRPPVVTIGEATQGALSGVLGRKLPNGWNFRLPNELYVDPQGSLFEGVGIPPDIKAPVFSPDDLAAGRDSALETAIAFLSR